MATHPPLPPMLEAILVAATAKFPGKDWAAVQDHLRKAWNAVAHDAPWEAVRDDARRVWEAGRK